VSDLAASVEDGDAAEPSPTEPTLAERMAASGERLTQTEADVGRYFLDHTDEVAFQSAVEIAAVLGISDASVIRAAQALGYSGLAELKRELAQAIRLRAHPAARYQRSLEVFGQETGELIDHLIAAQVELLEAARASLDPGAVRAAIDLALGADRIVVFGVGPIGPLTEYFVQAARRFGRHALALTGRGSALADGLMELRSGDVLILIAYERIGVEVAAVADRARAVGISTILVTDSLSLALAGRHAVALTAARGTSDAAPTQTVPMTILEILLFGIVAQDRERALAALDELRALRERIELV
jgi:DNA-binding MurR/RpiR family transcriptional regulator